MAYNDQTNVTISNCNLKVIFDNLIRPLYLLPVEVLEVTFAAFLLTIRSSSSDSLLEGGGDFDFPNL